MDTQIAHSSRKYMNVLSQLTITNDRYRILKSEIENSINQWDTNLLKKHPIDEYIKYLELYPKYAGLKYCSDDVKQLYTFVEGNGNKEVMETYHKLLLIRLIYDNQKKIDKLTLPKEVNDSYRRDFGRIVSQVENRQTPEGYFLYSNDRFHKDLAICCLRLFPIGGRKYEFSLFPIKLFLRNCRRPFIKVLFYLIFQTRGIVPFIQGHYDTEDPNFIEEFNIEGFINAYRVLAEVMKLNPNIKGYFGINWINDPNIERVSPRLAYIRYFNLACGAKYYCLGSDDSAIKNAVMKSEKRKKLYQKGLYLPTNYMNTISNRNLIAWADKSTWHWQ